MYQPVSLLHAQHVEDRRNTRNACYVMDSLPLFFSFFLFPLLPQPLLIPGPDIQVPEEEYTSPESEIKSGIHILCKCTLLKAGIKKCFGIIILEGLIV